MPNTGNDMNNVSEHNSWVLYSWVQVIALIRTALLCNEVPKNNTYQKNTVRDYFDRENNFYLSDDFIRMADELLHDNSFYYPEQIIKPVFGKKMTLEDKNGNETTVYTPASISFNPVPAVNINLHMGISTLNIAYFLFADKYQRNYR